MPDARGRGVGAALTVIALRVAPNKPATLFATAEGLRSTGDPDSWRSAGTGSGIRPAAGRRAAAAGGE
jgi:hypothetical protein